MRVVTFNIHGWRTADNQPNLDGVTATLRALEADIIGLNEVYYPRVIAGDARPALEALADRLSMHFVFGPCLRWPVQDDMPAGAYGNALLSRWPIIASSAHHLAPKEEDRDQRLEGKEQRGLLEGRVLLPDGKTLTVYITHLDHTDEEARLVQLRVARTWLVRDRNRPHLVIGDFNTLSPWDMEGRKEELTRLLLGAHAPNLLGARDMPQVITQMEKAGYIDLYRRFGVPEQRTFLSSNLPIRIDYIFANAPLASSVTGCTIWADSDGISDHRPVVADFA
ncbi:MAG: endonuclease/exonuclease/phosphatase family protein [Caldilineaceae bacterium]|nr:endonuclease/exonuclease/phosphatase family protein [Caldilineaceae bacterium]